MLRRKVVISIAGQMGGVNCLTLCLVRGTLLFRPTNESTKELQWKERSQQTSEIK